MSEKTEWRWLTFDKPDKFVLAHAARGRVRDAVVGELEFRGCTLSNDEDLPMLFLDEPGMVSMKRPIEKFDFFGLALEIPSEDMATFVLELEGLKRRTVGDVDFYKLHGYMRCLCLSVNEYGNLLVLLRNRLPEAERRSSEFYAVNKLPSEVLREAAAASTGKSMDDIPNLGGNKQDRFKPKGGAKA